MKVVVTGGSGKASRAIVRCLVERRHERRDLDYKPTLSRQTLL